MPYGYSFLLPLLMVVGVVCIAVFAFRHDSIVEALRCTPLFRRVRYSKTVRIPHAPYLSVSRAVEMFFAPFDEKGAAARVSERCGDSPGRIIEGWALKREMARQKGIFLHSEIYRYLSHRPFFGSFHFAFRGTFFEEDCSISLEKEEALFLKFLRHSDMRPRMMNRLIADTSLRLVGRIPCLARTERGLALIDWKSNGRISDDDGRPLKKNTFGAFGINGLENISDTPYWRYALKMNLYRYLIGKMEHADIPRMFLVDISPDKDAPAVLNVPLMKEETDKMLSFIAGDLRRFATEQD